MEGSTDISELSDQDLEDLISEAGDRMVFEMRNKVAVGWAIRYNILSGEREERRYKRLKESGYKRVFTFAPPEY